MKLLKNIEAIDLALYIDEHLILSDFHIGYEEALNKQGILLPRFQFKEIIQRLEAIFERLKNKPIEKIIINGDLKHEFGTISEQEWRHTLKLIDFLGKHCSEIVLIRGNHDTILGPIAEKRKVKVLEHYFIEAGDRASKERFPIIKKTIGTNDEKIPEKNSTMKETIGKKALERLKILKNKNPGKNKKILVIHGDKIPSESLLKEAKAIIIGHEHPAVSIQDGPRTELFKCFLAGKYKGKSLIAMPSFNLVTEGTDIMKERLLSPLLKQNLKDFRVFAVADRVYGFGKVKELIKDA